MAKKLACEEAAKRFEFNGGKERESMIIRALRAEARELKARRKNKMSLADMRELKRLRRLIVRDLGPRPCGCWFLSDLYKEAARIQKGARK